MSNFNWSNYIGKHMDEPLRITHGRLSYSVNMDNIRQVVENPNCKPLIKSISDLTDEEWLFVFWDKAYKNENKSDYEILRYKEHGQISLYKKGAPCCSNSFYLDSNEFEDCNQQILNRLYSLHISLDYDELIKNDKAVRKG